MLDRDSSGTEELAAWQLELCRCGLARYRDDELLPEEIYQEFPALYDALLRHLGCQFEGVAPAAILFHWFCGSAHRGTESMVPSFLELLHLSRVDFHLPPGMSEFVDRLLDNLAVFAACRAGHAKFLKSVLSLLVPLGRMRSAYSRQDPILGEAVFRIAVEMLVREIDRHRSGAST